MSSVYFYEMLTTHTRAECDQMHLNILLSSRASIPDRTDYITGRATENPLPQMRTEVGKLASVGADIIAIPCNTAHYFLPRLRAQTALPILDMPAITAQRCAELVPGKRACVLATKGTLRSGVYSRALEGAAGRQDVPPHTE